MVGAREVGAGALVDRVITGAESSQRFRLGVTGPPGVGKTTFCDALADLITARYHDIAGRQAVARVPMDGFHLADRELERLGIDQIKGAPETFDVDGYVNLLQRLSLDQRTVVYAPSFDRELDQAVAGSIAIYPETRVVITEGNYLLSPQGVWSQVRSHLDEVWYLDLPDVERRQRLIARHQRFGKTPDEALAWADGPDEQNAETIRAVAAGADLRVPSDVLGSIRL